MSLSYQQSKKWHQQANGATGQQTALTLISMDGHHRSPSTGGGRGFSGLKKQHNQFHALHKTLRNFSVQQTATPPFMYTLTLHKELKPGFHRLWKFKHDTALHAIQLDLFRSRVQELPTAMQSFPFSPSSSF
jgi:hypothetical protein